MKPFYYITFTVIIIDIITFVGLLRLNIISGNKVLIVTYWAFTIFLLLSFFSVFSIWPLKHSRAFDVVWLFLSGFLIISFFPKVFFSLFYIIDETVHHTVYLILFFIKEKSETVRYFIIAKTGLALSAFAIILILYGIFIGKHQYKFIEQTVSVESLPESFNGFKIVQISDIHIGSFLCKKNVKNVFDKINTLKPDIIVCTGDWVNNFAGEMKGWTDVFKKLDAKHGKYGILGNHDYSDYIPWETISEKEENMVLLKQYIQESGFHLLCNESVIIKKGSDSIALAGIENWGAAHWQPKFGNLEKALNSISDVAVKILLSHDPSLWRAKITDKTDIQLTLSGHTHGMQIGIKSKNIKWSPVKFFYPEWGGLYTQGTQHLYVNTGFGFIGYPGRLGINPEISCIVLKKN